MVIQEILIIFVLYFQNVLSEKIFECRLKSYENMWSTLETGECCDELCKYACNNVFTICLTDAENLSSCKYGGLITSKLFPDDKLTFGEEISFMISNPLQVKILNPNINMLFLSVNVSHKTDDEFLKKVARFDATFDINETDFDTTISQQVDSKTSMGADSSKKLYFSNRVYCDRGYLPTDCRRKKCVPQNNAHGHYTCNKYNEKVCLKGYKDPVTNCTREVQVNATSIYSLYSSFVVSLQTSTTTYDTIVPSTKLTTALPILQTESFISITQYRSELYNLASLTSRTKANILTSIPSTVVTHFETLTRASVEIRTSRSYINNDAKSRHKSSIKSKQILLSSLTTGGSLKKNLSSITPVFTSKTNTNGIRHPLQTSYLSPSITKVSTVDLTSLSSSSAHVLQKENGFNKESKNYTLVYVLGVSIGFVILFVIMLILYLHHRAAKKRQIHTMKKKEIIYAHPSFTSTDDGDMFTPNHSV